MKFYILFLAVVAVLLTSCTENDISEDSKDSLTYKQTEASTEANTDTGIEMDPESIGDEDKYTVTADDLFAYEGSPVFSETDAKTAFKDIMERKGFANKDYTYTCSKRESTNVSDYYIFQEYYKGIEVYGGQFIMQADKDDGQIITLNGDHINIPKNAVLTPKLSKTDAEKMLTNKLQGNSQNNVFDAETMELKSEGIYLFPYKGKDIRLIYVVKVVDKSSGFDWNSYIMDANDGSILGESNGIMF